MTTLDNLIDYKQSVEALTDAVIVADPIGAIWFWNPAAERLFGFTEAEALGNSLDLVVPERFRERHWAGYNRTMATGQTRYANDVLRVPAVHKDGRQLSIAFTVGAPVWPTRKCHWHPRHDSRRNRPIRRRPKSAQTAGRARTKRAYQRL